MISSPIVPAIIPGTQAQLHDFARVMFGVPELHVDVVDGKFVPFTSWPYIDGGEPRDSYALLDTCSLEVDLMVENPLLAARSWLLAGADLLVFHVETISVEALADFASTTNVTIGISANNDTPFETLDTYFPYVDYVQVMGIAKIGSQGQAFDERAITRIAMVRETAPQLAISLDGSVNAATWPQLAPLALDRYIVGSAIAGRPDPKVAYQEFCQAWASSTGTT
jgi:ribulose-phosphate 3-epimerase